MIELLGGLVLCVGLWLGFAYMGPSDDDRERLKEYAAIQGIKLGDIRPAPLMSLNNLRFPRSYGVGPRFYRVQFTEADGHGSEAAIALDLDYQGQLRVIHGRTETTAGEI